MTIPEGDHLADVAGEQPLQSQKSNNVVRKEALTTIGVLLSALVLAFTLISFVFQTYQVSGHSMEQTLQNGDHLLVWKVLRTWARITRRAYVPARGDIVILNADAAVQAQCDIDHGSQLIKRVVGLPGDRVVVANGKLTIYNKQHPNGFLPDKTLPYHEQITETATSPTNIDETLGPDQVFVAGDNRQNSCDSRYFGPINAGQIVGKLVVRVLPVNELEIF